MTALTRLSSQISGFFPKSKTCPVNVGQPERLASIVGGAAMVVAGASRRSLPGALLALAGGLLVCRGASGHCHLYDSLGVDTRWMNDYGVPGNKGIKVTREIEVQRPPSELFYYWKTLSNLPKFMPHVVKVEKTGDKMSRWVVQGPAGVKVEWDAEIINEHPGELIAWRSLPGADVESAGSVRFESRKGGAFTHLRVTLQYHPPAGRAGAVVAGLLGEAPGRQLARDLEVFKEMMESDGDGEYSA
ncbi:MAG: SRPBCC family protein [Verrucomicrobia bacterium]|nr:SRPBCC family protein [Verrucomicrobiota bacterium]